MGLIRVSAAVIRDAQQRFLLVRKKGTTTYMFPGGKPEPGELPHQVLVRELDEELGLHVTASDLTFWGTFVSQASNEPDTELIGDVFVLGELTDEQINALAVDHEIADATWVTREDILANRAMSSSGEGPLAVAPMTRERVVPTLDGKGVVLYTGSSHGADSAFTTAVHETVETIAQHGDHIIYGAGARGLMGEIGAAAAERDVFVVGVSTYQLTGVDETIPRFRAAGHENVLMRPHQGYGHVVGMAANPTAPATGADGREGGTRTGGQETGARIGEPEAGTRTTDPELGTRIGDPETGAGTKIPAGEGYFAGLNRVEVCPTMSARKDRMTELSRAVVVMPGGIGTLDEFFDTYTQLSLGLHDHPIVLLNTNDYWRPLLDLLGQMVDAGFLSQKRAAAIGVAETPEEIYPVLERLEPVTPRWAPVAAPAEGDSLGE